MLIAFKDKSLIDNLKSQLCDEFKIKDLSATKKILGMEIQRIERSVSFNCLKGIP